MRFIPVHLRYLEEELGAHYKTLRPTLGEYWWVVRTDAESPDGKSLTVGDVHPHSSLLLLSGLLTQKCPKDKLKKKLTSQLSDFNKKKITFPEAVAAGVCTKDGAVTVWTGLGLASPSEDDQKKIQEALLAAIGKDFKAYESPPDTGTFAIDSGKPA